MSERPIASIQHHFSALKGPRIDRTKLHKLLDIVVMAICAIICGADTWVAVESFGNAKSEWFKIFLELPNGTPSHDTFGRVFAMLDPDQFQRCFLDWITAVSKAIPGQVVAIDGKTLRRSHDKRLGKGAIVIVSAWATANRLVLAQVKVDDKSNEITAIPELLRVLDIAGCIIAIDAMGCQKEIAADIVERDADYLLALKGNQGRIHEDVELLFADLRASRFSAYKCDYARLDFSSASGGFCGFTTQRFDSCPSLGFGLHLCSDPRGKRIRTPLSLCNRPCDRWVARRHGLDESHSSRPSRRYMGRPCCNRCDTSGFRHTPFHTYLRQGGDHDDCQSTRSRRLDKRSFGPGRHDGRERLFL